MSDYGPIKDLAHQFKTKAEAFRHLHNMFTNPVVVAERILAKFLATYSFDGHNDQPKLYNTFKIMKEEKQLTHSILMINLAVKLLPSRYREEFSNKLEEAKAELEDGLHLTAVQRYNLLFGWIEKKSRKLTMFCSDPHTSLPFLRPCTVS